MVQFGLDQVAASSAQLRGEHEGGRAPSARQKASQASADIPIILLVNTLRTWPRAHLSVCVGRTLVELFMTGLIGLIEDIKITCQPRVSSTPSQSDNS